MQFQEEQDYNKRFDASLWKRLFHYAKPFHGHLILICSCMLLSAFLDVQIPLLTREAITPSSSEILWTASVFSLQNTYSSSSLRLHAFLPSAIPQDM